MIVFFRVDASTQIGSGHVMRCLALAERLVANGVDVNFICRKLEGDYIEFIKDRKYKVWSIEANNIELPTAVRENSICDDMVRLEDAEESIYIIDNYIKRDRATIDWLVVDHYGIDWKWEKILRPFVKQIFAIDDMANRYRDCDLLLDQNIFNGKKYKDNYSQLVDPKCVKLYGPKYALLRKEFKLARKTLHKRRGKLERILIFFGSADPYNETAKALRAIKLLDRPDIAVDVIVGLSNPHAGEIESMCEKMPNVFYYCQVDNIETFMQKADLSIGAGGSVTWERCYLGLPAVVIVTADNQELLSKNVAATDASICLGYYKNVSEIDIYNTVKNLANNKKYLSDMEKAALDLFSGDYLGTDLVANRMRKNW